MNIRRLKESTGLVQTALGTLRPDVSLVLGSGWSGWLDRRSPVFTMPYDAIPVMGKATVSGHEGRLAVFDISGARVLCFLGRRHLYEGAGWEPVIFPSFLSRQLDLSAILLTCAAGAINRGFSPGDVIVVNDHINGMGSHPLIGPHDSALGPRFPDLSEVYHPRLRQLFAQAAAQVGQPLQTGVYAAVSGPTYETPAEVRALAVSGADLVGMSTVPEAILARSLALPVMAVAAVTNMAAGLANTHLDHSDVLSSMSRNTDRIHALFSVFFSLFHTQFTA